MDDNNPVAIRGGTIPIVQTNIKENKNNYIDINNSQVTFNLNMPQPATANSASQMIAVQNFSQEYYQLLVTCEEDVFEHNVVTISANRALGQNYVPPEILRRCSSLSEEGIAELKTFPAIICMENKELRGIADPNQWAMYAYITRVKKVGRDIKVAFQPLSPIHQQTLCEKRNAIYFDLNMDVAITELNHCAWYVKKVNLFEAFDVAGITDVPRPARKG